MKKILGSCLLLAFLFLFMLGSSFQIDNTEMTIAQWCDMHDIRGCNVFVEPYTPTGINGITFMSLGNSQYRLFL